MAETAHHTPVRIRPPRRSLFMLFDGNKAASAPEHTPTPAGDTPTAYSSSLTKTKPRSGKIEVDADSTDDGCFLGAGKSLFII